MVAKQPCRAPVARKEEPHTLSQSSVSRARPFMHNEGMDMDPGADSSPLHDVNTIVHFTPNITNIILYYDF